MNHLEGISRMYRSIEKRLVIKQENEITCQKDTWFRKDGYTSTLTVPATPDSYLAKLVKDSLKKGRQPEGTKTKVIEDGGVCTKAGIVKSNQFPRSKCHREECMVCIQQDGRVKQVQCDKGNIG